MNCFVATYSYVLLHIATCCYLELRVATHSCSRQHQQRSNAWAFDDPWRKMFASYWNCVEYIYTVWIISPYCLCYTLDYRNSEIVNRYMLNIFVFPVLYTYMYTNMHPIGWAEKYYSVQFCTWARVIIVTQNACVRKGGFQLTFENHILLLLHFLS